MVVASRSSGGDWGMAGKVQEDPHHGTLMDPRTEDRRHRSAGCIRTTQKLCYRARARAARPRSRRTCAAAAQAVGIIPRASERGGDAFAAVGVEHHGVDRHRRPESSSPLALDVACPGGHGDDAAALELGQRARSARTARWVSGSSRLAATPGPPRRPVGIRSPAPPGRPPAGTPAAQPLGDVPLQAQPVEPRPGQDHRVEPAVERLVQPGLDVAPQRHDLDVRPPVEELRPSPRRAGADPGAGGIASSVR